MVRKPSGSMQGKRKMSGGKSAHSFYPAPGIYHLQDSSLFGRTFCQRLLFRDGVILIRKNTRTEIIFRDGVILIRKNTRTEIIFRDGVILIRKNTRTGIIFQRWSNPDSEEYSYRDYFMVMESIFIRQNLQLDNMK